MGEAWATARWLLLQASDELKRTCRHLEDLVILESILTSQVVSFWAKLFRGAPKKTGEVMGAIICPCLRLLHPRGQLRFHLWSGRRPRGAAAGRRARRATPGRRETRRRGSPWRSVLASRGPRGRLPRGRRPGPGLPSRGARARAQVRPGPGTVSLSAGPGVAPTAYLRVQRGHLHGREARAARGRGGTRLEAARAAGRPRAGTVARRRVNQRLAVLAEKLPGGRR